MSKRRILVVVNYFYPYVSGVSEYARSIAKELAGQNEVTILTGKHRSDLEDEELFEGYRIVRANPLVFVNKGYISTQFVRLFIQMSRACDVVNLHLPMLESGLLSILTSRPLLVTYHCDMALVGSLFNKLAIRTVRLSMRTALSRASSITVLSKDYAYSSDLLLRHRHKLVETSPPNRFEKAQLEPTSTRSNGKLLCGFVGRFVLEKGIGTILEAANLLKKRPIVFLLAGDFKDVAGGSVIDTLQDKLRTLGSTVQILGRLSDEELKSFYRDIDVLLLPSTNRFEAFGMVQMEAMTFGATVVTADMPGVRDTVQKTGIGQLCEPNNAESLANAILRAQEERSRYSRAEVRDAILNQFNSEKFSTTYQSLVQELVPIEHP